MKTINIQEFLRMAEAERLKFFSDGGAVDGYTSADSMPSQKLKMVYNYPVIPKSASDATARDAVWEGKNK